MPQSSSREDAEGDAVLLRGGGQGADGLLVIGNGGELHAGVPFRQAREAVRVRPHAGHGQHDIGGASVGTHFVSAMVEVLNFVMPSSTWRRVSGSSLCVFTCGRSPPARRRSQA